MQKARPAPCFLFKDGIRQRSIFPGRRQPSIVDAKELNCCVRNGNRCGLFAIATGNLETCLQGPWGIPLQPHRENQSYSLHASANPIVLACLDQALGLLVPVSYMRYRTSTPGLSTLSSARGLTPYRMGDLILRGASRLDAFRVYPVRTWPPGHAPGETTCAPSVRSSWSSLNKYNSSQISFAHDG